MGTYEKQQLLESLSYVEIARGTTRPVKLDELLSRRMESFMDRRLKTIVGGTGALSPEDL